MQNVANVFSFYEMIESNMVFQCINIRQVPWEVLKTAAFGFGFQHLPRDLANVNAWKKKQKTKQKKTCLIPIFNVKCLLGCFLFFLIQSPFLIVGH